jgi:hypothetical protein
MSTAWCADAGGRGSPIVTTPDGMNDFVVWALGAGGNNKLHGFDGDTGADLTNGGTAALTGTSHNFLTPIVAKGKMFIANDSQAFAYAPQ